MEWIEKVLHVSPDGGNGLFESLIFALLILGLAAPYLLHRRRARRPQSQETSHDECQED